MAIVIKEIQINTIIEKKVVQETEISDDVYEKIKEEVIRSLSRQLSSQKQEDVLINSKKKER